MSAMMQTLELAGTGRVTTRLGYGCSSLMGALNRRDSVALLDAAYDAGFRHFDVAPMYGFGAAEECVGQFLSRHDDVTVTTKYGIPAAKSHSLMGLARSIAGPIARRIPALKKRMLSVAAAVSAPAERASFTAEQAKTSLESSLRKLQTERVDVWLLHEVQAEDLSDDGLLRFLEDAVTSGKVGSFGVGSERSRVKELVENCPDYCHVLQYEWSILDEEIGPGGPFRIHHRSLTNHFHELHEALRGDAALCRRWSEEVGVEMGRREALANLMLKAALEMNPQSVVLVSSKNPVHLEENVAAAGNGALAAPARRLHSLLQAEGMPRRRGVTA